MDEVTRIFIFATAFTLSAVILLLLSFNISRRRQLQHKKQLLEKEFQTREDALLQVSRDLHDDIGSSLSGINILSQLAQQQLSETNNGSATELLQKINLYTGEVIEKVSDMAWLLKTNRESLSILISKLKAYSVTIAAPKNILVHFQHPPEIAGKELSIQQRKSIYLISKEALNNAIKYSNCKNIFYTIQLNDQQPALSIKDDGKGFVINETSTGNGLANMKARANEIGANLQINTAAGKGTEIVLEL